MFFKEICKLQVVIHQNVYFTGTVISTMESNCTIIFMEFHGVLLLMDAWTTRRWYSDVSLEFCGYYNTPQVKYILHQSYLVPWNVWNATRYTCVPPPAYGPVHGCWKVVSWSNLVFLGRWKESRLLTFMSIVWRCRLENVISTYHIPVCDTVI